METYTAALGWLAIPGVLLYAEQQQIYAKYGLTTQRDMLAQLDLVHLQSGVPYWGALMCITSFLISKNWERKSALLALRWGVRGIEAKKQGLMQERQDYKGAEVVVHGVKKKGSIRLGGVADNDDDVVRTIDHFLKHGHHRRPSMHSTPQLQLSHARGDDADILRHAEREGAGDGAHVKEGGVRW